MKQIIFFFLLFAVFQIIFTWFDKNEKVIDLLTIKNLIKWVLQSLLWAFFITLWSEPAEKEEV